MADSPRKRKPLISKKQKRIVLFFGLALALPIVILGALSNQDTRQQASERMPEKPNIILLTTEAQSPDTLEYMPVVRDLLGGQGVTFSHAFAQGDVLDAGIRSSLADIGYRTEDVDSVDEAVSFITTAEQPYLLSLTMQQESPENRGNCGNYVLVSDLSVNEADVSDKPRQVRGLPRLTTQQMESLATQKTQDFCAFQDIDTEISSVLQALGEARDDTIIVYTSRSGKSYGEHRYTGSDCLYDACIRVPLIISFPRMVPEAVRTQALAATKDISATVRQLVGLPGFDTSAISLLPLFTRPDVAVRPNVLLSIPNEGSQSAQMDYAVRTVDFMYSVLSSGEREFYDLQADPLQLVNQVTNTDYATAIEDLSLELARMVNK